MKLPIKKENYNASIVFDDSCFDNIKGEPLSVHRSQEIENLILPQLLSELEILKKTHPLFKKKSKVEHQITSNS